MSHAAAEARTERMQASRAPALSAPRPMRSPAALLWTLLLPPLQRLALLVAFATGGAAAPAHAVAVLARRRRADARRRGAVARAA
jgi:hypothetical protein